jgi:NAD(P)-dependent dehydrogenase (short-subunit alcohol dehydrogenase family)
MGRLSQRVAIVTGGGRGIGRGIVLRMAEAGADIAIADVDVRSAEETANEVASLGGGAITAWRPTRPRRPARSA